MSFGLKLQSCVLCLLMLFTLTSSSIILQRVNLTSTSSSSTIQYQSFSSNPSFTYFIESIHVTTTQIKISHTVTTLNLTHAIINFAVEATSDPFTSQGFIEVGLIFSDQQYVLLGVQKTTTTNPIITFPKTIVSEYYLNVFCHSIPFDFNITGKNSTQAQLSVRSSSLPSEISIGYFLVTKPFISNQIFIAFEQFAHDSADFLIQIDQEGYLDPSSQNTALILMAYEHTHSTISIQEYSNHDYDGTTIAVGYNLSPGVTHLKSIVLSFNLNQQQCAVGSYFKYLDPFKTVPAGCGSCDVSCLTCMSSIDDSCYTNENFCTSCGDLRYFDEINPGYGNCPCIKGLQVDRTGNCIPCSFDCLSFAVSFLTASTTPEFLIVFTDQLITFDVGLAENLIIYVDGNQKQFTIEEKSLSVYTIKMDPITMKSCEQICYMEFRIPYPQKIYTDTKVLTKQSELKEIRNYYSVKDELPDQLNEAFIISSLLVGATATAGQTSLIKMLFEVEQIIEFHKYLNLDIPVVFKEFIEALSSFKFMDFTTVLPFDLSKELRTLSSDQMDNKGPFKIVYYENGANFFKNIIPAMFTFSIILILNFVLFLIFRSFPCQLIKKFSEKIKLRWMITLSDALESLIIPVSMFSLFQLQYTVLAPKFIWIYASMFLFCFTIIFFPFLVVIHVETSQKRKDPISKELFEDLFQDVQLNSRVSFVAYLLAFARKFFFAISLSPAIPGLIQVNLLIILNTSHLFLIIYILLNRLSTNKLKILARTVNILSLIALELVIMIYNINYSHKEKMIEMGITCTYLTIIVTVTGIIEIFIKIGQIVIQKTKYSQNPEEQQIVEKKKTIKCNLGRPLDYIHQMNDQDSSQASHSEQKSQIVPITNGQSWEDLQRSKKSTNKNKKSIYPLAFDEMPSVQLYQRKKPRRRISKVEESSSNSQIVPLQ